MVCIACSKIPEAKTHPPSTINEKSESAEPVSSITNDKGKGPKFIPSIPDAAADDTAYNGCGAVRAVAFSPDGTVVASGSRNGIINLRNAANGAIIKTIAGNGDIDSIGFNADGNEIIAGNSSGQLRFLDRFTGSLIRTDIERYGNSPSAFSVLSPDGSILAIVTGTGAATDATVNLYDAATNKPLPELEDNYVSIGPAAFSPDGEHLVAGGIDLKIWKMDTRKLVSSAAGLSGMILSVAFSPDGRVFAATTCGDVGIFETATGELITTLQGHQDWIYSVAFSPDGNAVVSGGDDWSVIVWKVSEKYDDIEANWKKTSAIRPSSVAASSTAAGERDGETHRPANAFDNDVYTYWVEGSPGPGLGEWLEIKFYNPVTADEFTIINFCYDNSLVSQYNIAKKMRIELDGYSFEANLKNDRNNQDIRLSEKKIISSARFIVEEVYQPERDATCIPEIRFYDTGNRIQFDLSSFGMEY